MKRILATIGRVFLTILCLMVPVIITNTARSRGVIMGGLPAMVLYFFVFAALFAIWRKKKSTTEKKEDALDHQEQEEAPVLIVESTHDYAGSEKTNQAKQPESLSKKLHGKTAWIVIPAVLCCGMAVALIVQANTLSQQRFKISEEQYNAGFYDGVLSDRASNYWKGVGYAQAREDLYNKYQVNLNDAQNLKAIRDYVSLQSDADFGLSEYIAVKNSVRALFPEMTVDEVSDFLKALSE